MAHSHVGERGWGFGVQPVVDRLGGVGLMAVMGVAVLGVAAGGPDWIYAWHVTAAVILFSGVLILGQYVLLDRSLTDSEYEPYRFGLQLLLLAGLGFVLYRTRTPGYGIGLTRTAAATNAFLLLMAFCVVARDPREYSVLQWVVLGCLATVLAIFFYHGLSISVTSNQARQPFWWGSIMAVGLVVLPQYLSRARFLWAVNRFAAVLVLLALPVYVIGEYTLFGLSFGFMGAYTIPVVGHEVPATRSLFVNRNAFGVVVFAGFVAAIAEVYRTYVRGRAAWLLVVPLALLGINAIGLALSYGRALWVITPMALGVYVMYLVFGWRAVPVAVVGGFVYLLSGIAAVHSGLLWLPEDTPTRAARWYPSIAAIVDHPSLIGAGLIDPGAYIAPYQGGSEYSPHNSYLTMAIRAGLLGGFAYGLLIASSLLAGLLDRRAVGSKARVGLVALGVGFAAHQVFEAYTLFNWNSSTLLAVLVFGFLGFGRTVHSSVSREEH